MEKYRLLKKEECEIKDTFWSRYIELVRKKVIPYQWQILNNRIPDSEPSHAIDNFRIAAGEKVGYFYGEVFQDSDVYKWLEAVGNILMLKRDIALEEKADFVIDIIAGAQEADGYLNTYFTIEAPGDKWTNVLECHELYCAGHFIEAAVSYYKATCKDKVLTIAKKLADHIGTVFGAEEGKLHGYPGHQEIELALLKLYDLTGIKAYLELSAYFINTRGTNQFFEEEFQQRSQICFWTKSREKEPNRRYNQFPYAYYNQFHLPVREQQEAVGHAVRGVYMYAAMADLAGRTNDRELFAACRSLWNNIVNKQMYITGGIGATHSGEAFTVAYDLPNDTNYAETCASVGLMFFAQKMLKAEVDRSYGDIIEQALYNTILGGMNYEGNRFFYVNPLAVVPCTCHGNTERNHVKPIRQKWFACACCPPNIARTLAGLWEYIYTIQENTAYVHLFIGSQTRLQLSQGILSLRQETGYPWQDRVTFEIQSDVKEQFCVAIRIPSFCNNFQLFIDGVCSGLLPAENGYLYINRCFHKKVVIELKLDLKPRFMQANKKVHYNAGKVAITRGPIVYCLEAADNGPFLNRIILNGTAKIKESKSELWNDSVLLEIPGYRREEAENNQDLYRPLAVTEREITVTAIPYHLWNNRTPGEMQVWTSIR